MGESHSGRGSDTFQTLFMKSIFYGTLTALTLMTFTNQTASGRTNPLLAPSQAPHGTVEFNKLTPADYEEAILEGFKEQLRQIEAIVSNPEEPTFENTIVALDRSGRLANEAVLALSNVEHANGDVELMELMTKLTPVMSDHSSNIMLNEGLFERIKKVYDNRAKRTDLSPEAQRLITETYDGFVSSGANLKGKDRERFRQLSAEISDLNIRFAQNVTNGMKEGVIFFTEEESAGLPETIKKAAHADYVDYLRSADPARVEKGDTIGYAATMYFPSMSPILKYADNRNLRERLYKMYNSRNQSGAYDNTPLIRDIANVRLEMAKLMGKDNFAQYQLQHTMAAKPEAVYDMLNQLREAYAPAMQKELQEITEFARKTQGPDFVLQPWDYSYWSDKLKQAQYSFNDEDMKPYFELHNTIDGVFGLATKLYGYKFKPNKNIPVYHPDAMAYEVYDRDGKLLGILYADFFYRQGKSAGAWMTEYRSEVKDDKGNREIPFISIVCNFSKPVGNDPVLLTPYEVETFLHEFGHALHGLSAQATYESLSGTNVYHDFVELFSQFNENYLTEKAFLDSFAKHYKTGKKMPKELVDKFIKASQFGAAYACMRQLNFGFLDMAYHSVDTPIRATADLTAFEDKAIEPVKIFDRVEGCMISPTFSHVFSGGYAAGYYGYKWSELLDADAFAAFQENGIFDRKTADKFLHMLQAGGTADPMELYVGFRGKKPTVDALLKRDGIK